VIAEWTPPSRRVVITGRVKTAREWDAATVDERLAEMGRYVADLRAVGHPDAWREVARDYYQRGVLTTLEFGSTIEEICKIEREIGAWRDRA
jgi:hypothetical protein